MVYIFLLVYQSYQFAGSYSFYPICIIRSRRQCWLVSYNITVKFFVTKIKTRDKFVIIGETIRIVRISKQNCPQREICRFIIKERVCVCVCAQRNFWRQNISLLSAAAQIIARLTCRCRRSFSVRFAFRQYWVVIWQLVLVVNCVLLSSCRACGVHVMVSRFKLNLCEFCTILAFNVPKTRRVDISMFSNIPTPNGMYSFDR